MTMTDSELATMTGVSTIEMPLTTLIDLSTCAVMAADDNSRPILTALRFVVSSGSVEVTATDSYRLVIMTRDVETTGAGEYLVPAKWLVTTVKAVKAAKADRVKLTLTEGRVHVAWNSGETSSDLVSGNYPKLSAIIDSWELAKDASMFVLQPKFLADWSKIAPFNDARVKTNAIQIEQGRDGKPCKFSGQGFYGFQMPVRIN